MEKEKNFWMIFGKTLGCHQKHERSFIIKGKQFFLCARCSGIFLAEIVLAPILYLLSLHFGFYTILFVIPLVIDGSLQYYKILKSTNLRRFITGLLGGYAVGITIIHILVKLFSLIF